jgi:mRNA interferase MazF
MAKWEPAGRSATKSVEPYCPDAGDFIWLQFDPQAGREQAGRRPAIVLSPRKYNQFARLCVLCPMTNQSKGYHFEVAVPAEFNLGGGVILADQVKSLSWQERQSEFAAVAPLDVLAEVRAKVKALLGF